MDCLQDILLVQRQQETFKVALQVIELPIKHPELFEALGVAQPKVSHSWLLHMLAEFAATNASATLNLIVHHGTFCSTLKACPFFIPLKRCSYLSLAPAVHFKAISCSQVGTSCQFQGVVHTI